MTAKIPLTVKYIRRADRAEHEPMSDQRSAPRTLGRVWSLAPRGLWVIPPGETAPVNVQKFYNVWWEMA